MAPIASSRVYSGQEGGAQDQEARRQIKQTVSPKRFGVGGPATARSGGDLPTADRKSDVDQHGAIHQDRRVAVKLFTLRTGAVPSDQGKFNPGVGCADPGGRIERVDIQDRRQQALEMAAFATGGKDRKTKDKSPSALHQIDRTGQYRLAGVACPIGGRALRGDVVEIQPHGRAIGVRGMQKGDHHIRRNRERDDLCPGANHPGGQGAEPGLIHIRFRRQGCRQPTHEFNIRVQHPFELGSDQPGFDLDGAAAFVLMGQPVLLFGIDCGPKDHHEGDQRGQVGAQPSQPSCQHVGRGAGMCFGRAHVPTVASKKFRSG